MDVDVGVRFLGCMGSVCLILQETVKSCAILHQQYENSSCSTYSLNVSSVLVWFFAILIRWCLIGVWICISPMTEDLEHLFIYLSFVYLLGWSVYSKLLLIFKLVLNWVFCLVLSLKILYLFWIQFFTRSVTCQIFSLIFGLLLFFFVVVVVFIFLKQCLLKDQDILILMKVSLSVYETCILS